MFKKTLSLILAVTMIFSITAVSSATPVFAQEGEAAAFLPLRMIFETEGAEVSWNDEGGFITVVYEGDIYNFSPGSNIAQFNNLEFELNYEIVMDEGRAFIAYDDIAFLFGEEYSLTKQTAVIMTHQFLEGLGIPGMTVALVDADLGYTWTFGAGFADIEAGRFVNEMTLFDIGSVTKTFTAYAVLQLVEQGIIDLDEPIVTYLPDFSVLPHPVYGGDYRNITARMLLAHISGVPGDTFDGLFVTGGQSPDYMNNFLAHMATRHMENIEMERAAYANNGTLLLGILVAEMSGFAENGDFFSGFSDFVSENILIPLGMNYATLHITPESYIAMPYIASFLPQEELLYVNPISVGGMFANAHDMSIYMHHILEQQRIENSPIWQMSQMQDFDFSLSQLQTGHGFHRMALPTVTVMGHDGGTPHFTTAMFFDFENGLGAFISTNGSAVGAGAVFELLDAILATAAFEKTGNLQNPPEPLPPGIPTELSTGELDLLEGYYSTFGWLILDDGVLRFPNVLGMFSAELSPFTDGSFGIFIEGEFVARLWFREINGNMAAFQGDRAETFATERIDVWEADENFERWIGDYNLRSSVPGNSPIAGETIAFGTDDNGLAFVSLLGSELPIIMVDDYTYFVSGRGRNLGGVIQFSVDADSGEIWVELIGGRFVR